MTDLQRAARFLYLQRLGFGGKVKSRAFGVDAHQGARFNVAKLEPMLAEIHERLAGVTIEQLPWADFVSRYDRPGMLFYLDPPYFGGEADYGAGLFDRAEFAAIAQAMHRGCGAFILSINDHPEIRETFAGLWIEEIDTTWTIGTKASGAKRVTELLISNFAPCGGAARA